MAEFTQRVCALAVVCVEIRLSAEKWDTWRFYQRQTVERATPVLSLTVLTLCPCSFNLRTRGRFSSRRRFLYPGCFVGGRPPCLFLPCIPRLVWSLRSPLRPYSGLSGSWKVARVTPLVTFCRRSKSSRIVGTSCCGVCALFLTNRDVFSARITAPCSRARCAASLSARRVLWCQPRAVHFTTPTGSCPTDFSALLIFSIWEA